MEDRPRIVVIGGGTGSFTVLNGLKNQGYKLTALVNMVDDGGSTGQLRDEYGVLPPGDVRQCLVALSNAPLPLRELFNFRFPGDSKLGGHSFGNLFLSSVEMMTDNFLEAIKLASEVLDIRGSVVPVTIEKCELIMKVGKKEIVGEAAINAQNLKRGEKPSLSLRPEAKITPEAKQAIADADLIVIAPGNLYCSILPSLIVDGMSDNLQLAKAPIVFITNLVNKPNNTLDYRVSDYVDTVEKEIGAGSIDYVLYNIDIPSEELLKRYTKDKEMPVRIDKNEFRRKTYRAIPGRLLSHQETKVDKNDILIKRTLIRHDGRAIEEEISKILKMQKKRI